VVLRLGLKSALVERAYVRIVITSRGLNISMAQARSLLVNKARSSLVQELCGPRPAARFS
jgi:hypothetical protein